MACDLCGSTAHKKLWDKTEREKQGILYSAVIRDKEGNIIHGRNVICKRCGLVYVEPKMSREELKNFYENDYRKIYKSANAVVSEKKHAETAFQLIHLKITSQDNTKRTLLDIGCSTGRLLSLFKQRLSPIVQPYGLEPSTKHCAIAKEESIEVTNGTIEDYSPNMQFDIITMLNALEHVYSPTEVLTKINSLLANDGYLLISAPNLYGRHVSRSVDVFLSNAHLYSFTIPTIKAYFRKCGFKVVDIFGAIEDIGEKMYILGQKAEAKLELPKFDEKEILVMGEHLGKWSFVYEVKVKINELGYS